MDLAVASGILLVIGACLLLLKPRIGSALKEAIAFKLLQRDKVYNYQVFEKTIATTGEAFFAASVRELAHLLEIDAVLIASRDAGGSLDFRTRAYWCDEGLIMNQQFSLSDSPCDNMTVDCHLKTGASDLFPKSSLLQGCFRASGFFALQLKSTSGQKIGLLAGMHRCRLDLQPWQTGIIKLLAERAASELEQKYWVMEALADKANAQMVLRSIGDGVITTDVSGTIVYLNPAAEVLTGWSHQQAIGMPLQTILHLIDEGTGLVIPDPVHRCLSEMRTIAPKTDNILIARGGERYSIHGTAAPMVNQQGKSTGVVLVFKDVSDFRQMQKIIVHQATHDPLTGLVNRTEFEQRLDKALKSAQAYESTHALLFLDLDQFKTVNDSAGHVAGDELLRQITVLLNNQLRSRDTLGRLGGDEFSVLLENCPLNRACRIADELINTIREHRFIWGEKSYQIGVSIGIVSVTDGAANKSVLMNQADQACYSAKGLGRGCSYVFTDQDIDKEETSGETIPRDVLITAISKERFLLLYQPIIALTQDSKNSPKRAEILLRMLDADNNYIFPGAFIPAANRFGLMKNIDRWVIHNLVSDYGRTLMQNPDLVFHLNLSEQSVIDDSMISFIIQQFEQTEVAPKQICFEISETVLINNFTSVCHFIECIGDIGCTFALDGFGNGLSSFAYLKSIQVEFIKIDGALIRNLHDDPITRGMVESINTMSRLLGVQSMAERVDCVASVEEIKCIGIDYAQGYYLGGPTPMSDFVKPRSVTTDLIRHAH